MGESVIKVEGNVFVFDASTNQYTRRSDKRIRIISLVDTGNIINMLPREAELDNVNYTTADNRLVVTDGRTFRLDINEFGVKY